MRRRERRALVHVLEGPAGERSPDGSVSSRQVAEVTLPDAELERILTPEYLERLARTYWRFLTRISLGILRVLYTPTSREIVVLTRPFVLLRFKQPAYEIGLDGGTVTWLIDRGLLVAPHGRGHGFLRIAVLRQSAAEAGRGVVRISSEVVSFFPTLAGWGRLARLGQRFYAATQLRLHVIVTNAFLRSLARLDLVESRVGLLAPKEGVVEGTAERETAGK